MAFDKVQLMRNILKQLKGVDTTVGFSLEAIDSLDENTLQEYFHDHVTMIAPSKGYSDSIGHLLSTAESSTQFLDILSRNEAKIEKKDVTELLDGAYFTFGDSDKVKGIRIDLYGNDLKVTPLGDVSANFQLFNKMQDAWVELNKAQSDYEKAQNLINSTPKPKEPGFFANLFKTSSYRKYHEYNAALKQADDAEREMKKRSDEYNRIQKEMAPNLDKANSIFKEREFIPQERTKEAVKEHAQPEITQEKFVNVDDGYDLSDSSFQFEQRPPVEHYEIENETDNNPDTFFEKKPDTKQSGSVEEFVQAQLTQNYQDEFRKELLENQKAYQNFDSKKNDEKAFNEFQNRFDHVAKFHNDYMDTLSDFPQPLMNQIKQSTQVLKNAGKTAVKALLSNQETPKPSAELKRAISTRMYLKIVADERAYLSKTRDIYDQDRLIGDNEKDCYSPENLEDALKNFDSLDIVNEIAERIVGDPQKMDAFLTNPEVFFGRSDDLENELRSRGATIGEAAEEEIDVLADTVEVEEETKQNFYKNEIEKSIKEEVPKSKPKLTEKEKVQQAADSFNAMIKQVKQTYYEDKIVNAVADSAEKCVQETLNGLSGGEKSKDVFINFAAKAILFESMRNDFIARNKNGEVTLGIVDEGKIQAELKKQEDLDYYVKEFEGIPIVKNLGATLAKDVVAFQDVLENHRNAIGQITVVAQKQYKEMQAQKNKAYHLTPEEEKQAIEDYKKMVTEEKARKETLDKENAEKARIERAKNEEMNRAANFGLLAVGPRNNRKYYDENMKEVGKQEFVKRWKKASENELLEGSRKKATEKKEDTPKKEITKGALGK